MIVPLHILDIRPVIRAEKLLQVCQDYIFTISQMSGLHLHHLST